MKTSTGIIIGISALIAGALIWTNKDRIFPPLDTRPPLERN